MNDAGNKKQYPLGKDASWNQRAIDFIKMPGPDDWDEAQQDNFKDTKLRVLEARPDWFDGLMNAYTDPQNPNHPRFRNANDIMRWYDAVKEKLPEEVPGILEALSAFPKAAAHMTYMSNPQFFKDRKYGVGKGAQAEADVDFWTSVPGLAAIGTILAGNVAGTIAGRRVGAPVKGALAGGSLIPAAVGQVTAWAKGDAPLPFSEGTDYEWDDFWQGLTSAYGTDARWKTMESQNWAQILGPEGGNMAAFYDMTQLDPVAEAFGQTLGFLATPAYKGLKGRIHMIQSHYAKKALPEINAKLFEAEQEMIGTPGLWPDSTEELADLLAQREKMIAKIKRVDPNGDYEAIFQDGSRTTIYPIGEDTGYIEGQATVKTILNEGNLLEPDSDLIEKVASKTGVKQVTKTGEVVETPLQVSEETVKQVAKETEEAAKDPRYPPMRGYFEGVKQFLEYKFGAHNAIWEQLVEPAIYGIRRNGKDGLVAYERSVAASGKLLKKYADEAGVGWFKESPRPAVRAMIKGKRAIMDRLDPWNLVFRGEVNEKNSRAIIDAIQAGDDAVAKLPAPQRRFATLITNMFDRYLEQINVARKAVMGPNAVNVAVKGRENYFPHMFTVSYFDGATNDLAKMSNEEIEALNAFLERQAANPYQYVEGAGKAVAQEEAWLRGLDPPADLADEPMFKNHFFPADMQWFGNLLPRETSASDYSRNIMDVMAKYISGANQVIHMSVPAARVERGIRQLRDLGHIDEDTYRYLEEWKDEALLNRASTADRRFLPGQPGFVNTSARLFSKLVQRTAANLIPASMTFFGQNLLSFPSVYMTKGLKATDVFTGYAKAGWYDGLPMLRKVIGDNPTPKELEDAVNGAFGEYGLFRNVNELEMGSALRESKVLQMRADTSWERLGEDAMKRGKAFNLFVDLIDTADQYVVAMAFNAGKRAAKRDYGKFRILVEDGTEELPRWWTQKFGAIPEDPVAKNAWWDNSIEMAAREFGDDLAGDTQAIYHKAMMSPLQRRALFRALAPFQTYVSQMSSYVRSNFFGKGSGRTRFWDAYTPAQKLGLSMKLYGAMIAANSLARTTGLTRPYTGETFVPGGEGVLDALDITDEPNRGTSLLAINNLRKMLGGLGSMSENGFDYDDASQRTMMETFGITLPRGGGLQVWNRSIAHLVDRGRGGIQIGTGKGGKREFVRFDPRNTSENRAGDLDTFLRNIASGVTNDPFGLLEGMALGSKRMTPIRGKKTQWRGSGSEFVDTMFPSINLRAQGDERAIRAGYLQKLLGGLGVDERSMYEYGEE
jgi:hypothetical protein